VDIGMFAGTMCFFLFLFLAFLRLLPFVPVAELKDMKHELAERHPT
jgi:molybdopterin-containing oxidoreductase family membrane subunit